MLHSDDSIFVYISVNIRVRIPYTRTRSLPRYHSRYALGVI